MGFVPGIQAVDKNKKKNKKLDSLAGKIYDVNMIKPTHFKMRQRLNYKLLLGSMF